MQKWIPWLYLALGLAQAAHSIEEVFTGLWRWMPIVSGQVHEHFAWVPILAESPMTFIVGNMVIIAVVLALSPLVFLNHTWAWFLATVIAVIETVNGLGHISAALAIHGYFSGCITAIGLLLISLPIWGRRWLFRKGSG